MKHLKYILLILSLLSGKAFAQTPTAPVQLTTNTPYLEPSTGLHWYYNGATYLWWKALGVKDSTYYVTPYYFNHNIGTSTAASIATKEPSITAGTTLQYWRGDKTFQTLNTAVVPELTNLYYTNARGIGSTLTGYTSGPGTISSADNILQAIQKLNGNIGALTTGVSSVTGTTNRLTASPTSGAVVVDISASYAGQASITTLGTIGTGTWQGAPITNTYIATPTISGITLGSNLANLTATNGTLTFSGSYNGSTARTIGLNLSNVNTWTGTQTFNSNQVIATSANTNATQYDLINTSSGGGNFSMVAWGSSPSAFTGGFSIYDNTSSTHDLFINSAHNAKFINNLEAGGTLKGVISAGGANDFVVSNSGVLEKRTAAQVLSDIGAAPASGGAYIIALTGDVTASGSGSVTATLATVNSSPGTYGSATQTPVLVVNGKGLVTSNTNTTITPAVGSITGLGTGVATALGVNIGSAGAPVLFNGAGGTPTSMVGTNITGTASGLTAGNVTTNANLTGPITSVGNATSVTAAAITNTMLAGGIDLTTKVTGILPIANGGTGVATGAVNNNTTVQPSSNYNIDGLATITKAGIGNSPTDALLLTQTTAATVGAQKISPSLHFNGNAWNTTGSVSESADFLNYMVPVQGTTPTANVLWTYSRAGGAGFTAMTLSSAGNLTLPGRLIVNSNVAFGAAVSGANNVEVTKNITGGTTAQGIRLAGSIQSDVTAGVRGFAAQLGTAATAFTVPDINNFYVSGVNLGAGSSVTRQSGFYVESNFNTATNNFGFRGTLNAATGVYNIYMDGSAANYINGTLLLGSSTPTAGTPKLDVTGSIGSTALAINSQVYTDANSVLTTTAPAGTLVYRGAGQTTLVSGTKAISVTGVTASSQVFVNSISQGGTVSTTFEYAAVPTSGTITITALTTGNVTNTLDTSTLSYFVIN
jgi:hypothetical protein